MSDPKQHETVLEATGAKARVARVYAEALMGVAAKSDQLDAVGDELEEVVAGVVKSHPRIQAFLAGSSVSMAGKLPVLAAAFEHRTSETFRKFVGVLNANGRLDLLPAISAELRTMRDAAAGRVRVKVTAPVPLLDAQVDALTKTLHAQLNAHPVLDVRIDPDILGGLIVQVGDKVYDTSVRTRLDNLRTHLTTSGTHG
jgi:F-type H+-transporting ATPase subunit delta